MPPSRYTRATLAKMVELPSVVAQYNSETLEVRDALLCLQVGLSLLLLVAVLERFLKRHDRLLGVVQPRRL